MAQDENQGKSAPPAGFTAEQWEALQIDAATGGDLPVIGLVGAIGKIGIKSAPELLAAAKALGERTITALRGGEEIIAIKEALRAERQAATRAAQGEVATDIRPVSEIIQEARNTGKTLSRGGEMKNPHGADEFLYHIDDLRRLVPANEFRQMAKQALADENSYRESLSALTKWGRAFKYDNSTHDSGFLVGLSRYGGTSMSHLKGAASDSEFGEMAQMVYNMVRGTAQVVGASIAGEKAVLAEETPPPLPNENSRPAAEKSEKDTRRFTSADEVHQYVADQAKQQGIYIQQQVSHAQDHVHAQQPDLSK